MKKYTEEELFKLRKRKKLSYDFSFLVYFVLAIANIVVSTSYLQEYRIMFAAFTSATVIMFACNWYGEMEKKWKLDTIEFN